MARPSFQNVRGMPDILPDDWLRFDQVISTFTKLSAQAGFGRMEVPILEEKALFVRSVGEASDIAEKEIYEFADRGGTEVALRPEGTAGVARAYIQHGLASWPSPVKLSYVGPMFRYDRPQAGRQRQHWQLGLELFGETAPSADAQVITLANRILGQIGVEGFLININSIGDANCRPNYQDALMEFLKDKASEMAEIDQQRLTRNPLRVLDSKEPATIKAIAEAPQTLNYLCKDCQAHFKGVLEYLDDLDVRYELNPHLVRGLDYYTRTVFEIVGTREGSQAAIAAGGRYDGLVEQLGGAKTPAVGIAFGVERLVLEQDASNVPAIEQVKPAVYVASLGEPARLAAFRLIEQLLDGGVAATGSVDKDSISGQLERADRVGARYAVIIGQKEVIDKTVILRDMTSGAQENIPLEKLVTELQQRTA